MNVTDPIRDKAKIETMKSMLRNGYGKKQGSLRDWLLLTLGLGSGLRISDLLELTVESVANQDRIALKESKTSKGKSMPWSRSCKDAIKEYLEVTGLTTGSLFPSRKQVNGVNASISRQQAWKTINDVAVAAKVITKKNGVHIGCHSLRKSFGFHAYDQGTPVETIQKLLNHSSSSVTFRYIGVTQDELDDVYMNLDI